MVAAGIVMATVAVIAAIHFGNSKPELSATPSTDPAASTATLPSQSPSATPQGIEPGATIATSAVEQLDVFSAPNGDVTMVLSQWSAQAFAPLTLMAVDSAVVDGEEWLEVLLPVKPNGSTGWIRGADVTVSSTDIAIDIYLDERELDLSRAGEVVATYAVAVGTPETPTPLGTFYITDPLDFSANPTSIYGAWALGISGFSEVLDEFYGGPPQVAIHGTNEPELIGQAVSNGCIRMSNDDIAEIAAQVDLGTPVIIHASRDAAAP